MKHGRLSGRYALVPLILLASLAALSGCGDLSGQQSNAEDGAFTESSQEDDFATSAAQGGSSAVQGENSAEQEKETEKEKASHAAVSEASQGTETLEVDRIETEQYSFELPGWWKGKYLMQETKDSDGNTYLIFRQKASYDTIGDGDLFTIATFHDASYVDLPSRTVWAYDKDTAYILMRPTDVCFNMDVAEIVEEYTKMGEDLEEIRQSFHVNGDSVRYDGEEYIFPTSDSIYLEEQNLWNLSEETLRIAKNEIYARHGYIFQSEDLNRYFKEKSWYQGSVPAARFDSSMFNEYEKANIKQIADYQEAPRFPFVKY